MKPLERVRHPEVVPLELGDVWVNASRLGRKRSSRTFPALLRGAIEVLHAGHEAASNGSLSAAVAGFDAVFLAGGRANEDLFRVALAGLPCALFFGDAGVYAGARGGFDWLRQRGLSGWVVDLGQSHLKLATPECRWIFPRDCGRLRAAHAIAPPELPAQRRRLREFLTLGLQFAMVETGQRPDAVVWALPTRVAEDGTPLGGDYAGMKGDRALLTDVLEQSGLAGRPLFVLNDAELTALSARLDTRLNRYRKIFVVTLGFGIGTALIQRESAVVSSE